MVDNDHLCRLGTITAAGLAILAVTSGVFFVIVTRAGILGVLLLLVSTVVALSQATLVWKIRRAENVSQIADQIYAEGLSALIFGFVWVILVGINPVVSLWFLGAVIQTVLGREMELGYPLDTLLPWKENAPRNRTLSFVSAQFIGLALTLVTAAIRWTHGYRTGVYFGVTSHWFLNVYAHPVQLGAFVVSLVAIGTTLLIDDVRLTIVTGLIGGTALTAVPLVVLITTERVVPVNLALAVATGGATIIAGLLARFTSDVS